MHTYFQFFYTALLFEKPESCLSLQETMPLKTNRIKHSIEFSEAKLLQISLSRGKLYSILNYLINNMNTTPVGIASKE